MNLFPNVVKLRSSFQRFYPQGAALVFAATLLFSAPVFGRNVIIFVADGLRNGSVNQTDAPTLYTLRQLGVDFPNSHALFPTFTTPNASAIATGHYLGDTGDFSNTLYIGFAIPQRIGIQVANTQTPFIENDAVLGCVDEHFLCNFLDEETLLALARKHGFATAAIGKLGPTLIQDIAAGCPKDGSVPIPETVIIDDTTGKDGGIPLDPKIAVVTPSPKRFSPVFSNRGNHSSLFFGVEIRMERNITKATVSTSSDLASMALPRWRRSRMLI